MKDKENSWVLDETALGNDCCESPIVVAQKTPGNECGQKEFKESVGYCVWIYMEKEKERKIHEEEEMNLKDGNRLARWPMRMC